MQKIQYFKGYELLQQEKESQNDKGFDTAESLVTAGLLLAAPVIYSKLHGYNNNTGHLAMVGLFRVVQEHNLEQRDIPTIDVGRAMLLICEFWDTAALKYTVVVCLMK